SDTASAKRQFERDKDLLRGIGIPVEVAATDAFEVEEGYVIPNDEYYLPEISFTPDEVAALFVAAQAPDDAQDAARAFLKLAQGVDASFLASVIDESGGAGVDVSGQHLVGIGEAVSASRRVRFRYRPVRGRGSEREVDAWALVFRHGAWYLVGRDRKRGEPRSFRLSRITSKVRDAGKGSSPPDGFDPEAVLIAGPWGLGKPEMTVRVAFSPKVGWWAVASAGGKILRTRKDGWTVGEVPAADPEAFVSWILSFGPDAKVQSPRALRDRVVARLEELRAAV
ncbi:MAG: helix-turn-helix transcriptional regulator, partial [Actinomycetota bacterium]